MRQGEDGRGRGSGGWTTEGNETGKQGSPGPRRLARSLSRGRLRTEQNEDSGDARDEDDDEDGDRSVAQAELERRGQVALGGEHLLLGGLVQPAGARAALRSLAVHVGRCEKWIGGARAGEMKRRGGGSRPEAPSACPLERTGRPARPGLGRPPARAGTRPRDRQARPSPGHPDRERRRCGALRETKPRAPGSPQTLRRSAHQFWHGAPLRGRRRCDEELAAVAVVGPPDRRRRRPLRPLLGRDGIMVRLAWLWNVWMRR